LRHAVPFFPPGTVHLAVVDPGVGSARRALCVETDTAVLVGPDNGLFSLLAPPPAVRRIVELTEERFFLTPRSATFHGRDGYAPRACALRPGARRGRPRHRSRRPGPPPPAPPALARPRADPPRERGPRAGHLRRPLRQPGDEPAGPDIPSGSGFD